MENQTGTQVILVTGGSSGIGAAIATKLAASGHTVYAAARRVDKMQPLAEAGINIMPMDVTVDEQMVDVVNKIIAKEGRIDVLINNAGYGSYGAVEDVSIAEARKQFEVNVFAMARMTQLVLPHMRSKGLGRIVNISSIGAKIYEPCGGWYHSTKYAVEGLSDCLRLELRNLGIKVIMIEPGAVTSEWSGIAIESLMKTSGETAYAVPANEAKRFLDYGARITIAPEKVADTVERAINSAKPAARYRVGKKTGTIAFAKRILSDRMFDKLIANFFKK